MKTIALVVGMILGLNACATMTPQERAAYDAATANSFKHANWSGFGSGYQTYHNSGYQPARPVQTRCQANVTGGFDCTSKQTGLDTSIYGN